MRIILEVHRTLDLEASRTRHRLYLHRLLTRVQFRHARGWSDYHVAIIDSGAPYSVLPLSLWTALRVERLLDLPLRGIVPGHAAEVDATLARVPAQLLDARRVSPHLALWAMLARTDEVPLILGWSGLLDLARLGLDGRRRSAWLAF